MRTAMTQRCTPFLFALITLFFAASNVGAQGLQLTFVTMLNGESVVPAVSTYGKGMVTLLFNNDQTKVNISGMILTLDGDVTEALLQIGPKGENGATLIDITPMIIGRRIEGDMDVPAGLIKSLVFNNLYVTIQTTLHPNGEIRGQFAAETDLNFRCDMSGSQLVPPAINTGFGFGGFHFALGSDEIDYVFLLSGLSGPVTETVIYEGDPGQNGTVLYSKSGSSGTLVFGLLDLQEDILPFVEQCLAEKIYIVLKTDAYPEGEIRGQIRFLGNLNSFAPVNGTQQVPSTSTSGFGFNYTLPNAALDSLTTTVFVVGIDPTSAQLHTGAPGTVGPVLTDMETTPMPGLYRKTYALTPAIMSDFANGNLYLNFGTVDQPDGEIRGVLRTSLRKGYAFDLCGAQTVPPTSSTALGMAMASVDVFDCYIDYKVITDGLLSGDLTSASIRKGMVEQNGDKLYSMPATSPFLANFHALLAGEGALIELESTYMEINTPAFPDGEIRGQIRRGQTCPLLAFGTGEPTGISQVSVYPVPFQDILRIQLESSGTFTGRLVLYDMLGKIATDTGINVVEGPQTFAINTTPLPPGIYQLVLEGQGKKMLQMIQK